MGYILRFGVFELDLLTEELRKFGTPIKLAPQPFQLLALLASQAGQVVTREQIQLQLWGEETYVDFEQGVNHCIKQIRTALNDNPDTPRYIETLARRGYRFIAPVEARQIASSNPEVQLTVVESPLAGEPEADSDKAPRDYPPTGTLKPPIRPRPASGKRMLVLIAVALAVAAGAYVLWRGRSGSAPLSSTGTPGRKSIAVLGFQNVSRRSEAAWYSTAFTEMLRTELAAGDQMRVVEGETVDRMKSDLRLAETDSLARDTLKRIQKMVGADYVLLGSYTELGKEAGGQIRLDLRVQNARTGETVVAVAETGTVDHMFDLVSRAGAELRPRLGIPPVSTEQAGTVRAMLPTNPEAARLYALALAKLRVYDANGARDLLKQSIDAEAYFAPAHSALAAAWKMLGYDKDARDEAQKAFKLASNLPREERLSIEARYRELNNEWGEAIALYQTLWHDFPDNVEYGLRLAAAQKSSGKPADALATADSLRGLPPPTRDDPRIDLASASANFALGNLKASYDAATQAAQKSESLGSSHLLARSKTAQAKVLFQQQEMPPALDLFRQSVEIYQQVGDTSGVTSSLGNIASVLQEQGQLSEAQAMYTKALALYLNIGDKSSAALTLNNMGAVYQRQRNFPEALKAYQRSLAIYRELGDRGNEGIVLDNLGQVLLARGELGSAGKTYQDALTIDRASDNRVGIAEALSDLAQVYAMQDNLAAAADSQKQALTIWTEIGDPDSAADARLALGQISLYAGRAQEAESSARATADGATQGKQHAREAQARLLLAQALLAQGRLAEALEAANRASTLAADLGDPAFTLSVRITTAQLQGLSAVAATPAALRSLQQCIADAVQGKYLLQEFQARLALGAVQIAQGDPSVARASLQGLQKQAAAKGYLLISREAGALEQRPTPK